MDVESRRDLRVCERRRDWWVDRIGAAHEKTQALRVRLRGREAEREFDLHPVTIEVMQWRQESERDDEETGAHTLRRGWTVHVKEVRQNGRRSESRQHARATMHRHAERVLATIEKYQRRANAERGVGKPDKRCKYSPWCRYKTR